MSGNQQATGSGLFHCVNTTLHFSFQDEQNVLPLIKWRLKDRTNIRQALPIYALHHMPNAFIQSSNLTPFQDVSLIFLTFRQEDPIL